MLIEQKIKDLGYELADAPKPLAAYVPCVKSGNFVFTAGQLPLVGGELKYVGQVGKDLSEEDGKKAAEISLLNCLSAIKGCIGELDQIKRIVKLTVFVSSPADFYKQPVVANGASELVLKIFGENGKHARSAVGVPSLPINAAVEIEMVAELK
ncbi:MAG: RidA family protein [Ignavibacteria bacterium]|nr:RidA family protein [Ignavibacteria bacterium]